jgi:hypothetical protein
MVLPSRQATLGVSGQTSSYAVTRILPRGRDLPDRTALIRLVAVLAEQHDEWTEGRRYLGLDVLARSRITIAPNPSRRSAPEPEDHPVPSHTTPQDLTFAARKIKRFWTLRTDVTSRRLHDMHRLCTKCTHMDCRGRQCQRARK